MTLARFQMLILVAAIGLLGNSMAAADPISRQNPYRSYNLSGVNYGSQQWERDHARAKASQPAVQQQRVPLFQRHRLRRQ